MMLKLPTLLCVSFSEWRDRTQYSSRGIFLCCCGKCKWWRFGERYVLVCALMIQLTSEFQQDKTVARESFVSAMRMYSPYRKQSSRQLILQSVHAIFSASLKLCDIEHTRIQGMEWACFMIENTPMVSTHSQPAIRTDRVLDASFSNEGRVSRHLRCQQDLRDPVYRFPGWECRLSNRPLRSASRTDYMGHPGILLRQSSQAIR